MLDEQYFNILKKNYDKYIKLDKKGNKQLEIKNKQGTKKVRCFIVSNDEDIEDEVDDKSIEINDYDSEKSDCIVKIVKKI